MKTLLFRAKFKNIAQGIEVWQQVFMGREILVHPNDILSQGYIQGTEWMQYTGVDDETGERIYEGDIVQCNNGHVGAVEWEEYDCCFNVTDYYSPSDGYSTMAFIGGQPMKVLGNIHENPELLA